METRIKTGQEETKTTVPPRRRWRQKRNALEAARGKIVSNEENVETAMKSGYEEIKAAIKSNLSKLERAISNRVENGLASVGQRTQCLRKELN
jgi:hypothetical protein